MKSLRDTGGKGGVYLGPVCVVINETTFLLSADSTELIRYAGVIDRCCVAAARQRTHAHVKPRRGEICLDRIWTSMSAPRSAALHDTQRQLLHTVRACGDLRPPHTRWAT